MVQYIAIGLCLRKKDSDLSERFASMKCRGGGGIATIGFSDSYEIASLGASLAKSTASSINPAATSGRMAKPAKA